jgi:NarL family two-component system response regulator LiaR
VKTHSSRVFDKLGAKRRTQAVQLGKESGLLA